MAFIFNTAHKVYPTVKHASDAVVELKSFDDSWGYVVVPDPAGSGRAIIKVYDESGEFIHNY